MPGIVTTKNNFPPNRSRTLSYGVGMNALGLLSAEKNGGEEKELEKYICTSGANVDGLLAKCSRGKVLFGVSWVPFPKKTGSTTNT